MQASAPNVADIDALLPQTQCTRCGFADCRAYAQALADCVTELNRCVPGGESVIQALSALLKRPPLPLDPDCGEPVPDQLVWIDPNVCIGCARCLPACPTDAILGAQQYLHTVLPDWCTGCELCIAVCPVDCIHPQPREPSQRAPSVADNRARYLHHRERAAYSARRRAELIAERKLAVRRPPLDPGAA